MRANLDRIFITISFPWIILGMPLGIFMGATGNMQFLPLHAHMNLDGFVMLLLMGLLYRAYAAMKDDSLALIQFWVSTLSVAILLVTFACILFLELDFEETPLGIVTIVSEYGMVLGAILLFIVFLRSRSASA